MIIQKIIGNIKTHPIVGLDFDVLEIEWLEPRKRIRPKPPTSGKEYAQKVTQKGQRRN